MIELGTLEIADLSDGYLFEFREGGPDDLATFRGSDDVVPEAAGRAPGQWIADTRNVRLYGIVLGTGSTVETRQTSYRARMDALVTEMDPATLLTITVAAPIFGSSGTTLANCRPMRIVRQPAMADQACIMVLELVCIDSPPQWEPAGS